ncbi:MAG: tRNA pseudouridine(55) synthase TruB [Candidatus Wildermuthbacteria bacterium]|nr:tRNA pseudouridine(55) synthase TruB [Candidatus Wildermuthbacteria bacterium]
MILNVRKPRGMTSHDVVNRIRKITHEKRVGHAGTLDPFAEGVLIVAVGREDTKKLAAIAKNTEKEYLATLELGKTSTTGDPEGTIEIVSAAENLQAVSMGKIQEILLRFKGKIQQTPPSFSAIKVRGVAAYKRARRGEKVSLPSRAVTIYGIEIKDFTPPFLSLKITCSAGTYIRSLAKDVGDVLGVGAYLTNLKRTRVGEFEIEGSKTLEEIKSALQRTQ